MHFLAQDVCQPCQEGCKNCDKDQCTLCMQGYRLDQGECKQCADLNCAQCDPITAECTACKPGSFLETGLCVKCPPMCLKCLNGEVCTECVAEKSFLVDGKCLCNADNNWIE